MRGASCLVLSTPTSASRSVSAPVMTPRHAKGSLGGGLPNARHVDRAKSMVPIGEENAKPAKAASLS